tara:strand:+ start:474 stop:1022 length:549 start_codon:yes stop_codon:yes gene_type:complete
MKVAKLILARWGVVVGLMTFAAGSVVSLAAASPSEAEAKSLIHGFLSAWESGDAETFATALHPDVVFAYPGGRLDYGALTALFTSYQKEKTDIKIYFADFLISDGDRYVTAYQFAATDVESAERFAVGTGIVCRFADGKLIEVKEYWDSQLASLQKSGEVPLDEGIVAPWPDSVWLRPDTID